MGEYSLWQLYALTVVSLATITVPAVMLAVFWWWERSSHSALSKSWTAVYEDDTAETYRTAA